MLQVEMRVNGALIGVANILNHAIREQDQYVYGVDYFVFDQDKAPIRFTVTHQREDGAEALVAKVFARIVGEGK